MLNMPSETWDFSTRAYVTAIEEHMASSHSSFKVNPFTRELVKLK
jgi:hypothetical protein